MLRRDGNGAVGSMMDHREGATVRRTLNIASRGGDPQAGCAFLLRRALSHVILTCPSGPVDAASDSLVGLVFIAIARRGFPTSHFAKSCGDIGRDAVRESAMADALAALSRAARL
jgi:hypothetical protein